ncbi:MAG: DUF1559 domain-containing protein, partial [Planctomycetota bacterium]
IRMQMLAILNYHDAMNRLPGQAITDAAGKPLLSWRVAILPYLDEGQLYSGLPAASVIAWPGSRFIAS